MVVAVAVAMIVVSTHRAVVAAWTVPVRILRLLTAL